MNCTENLLDQPAARFAAQWHAGQFRKGRRHEDFFEHPLRVARILQGQDGTSPDLLAAALLHDVLEDTPCPSRLIQAQFGSRVLNWVLEVTDPKTLLKSARKQRQVERASLLSFEAGMIRVADKIDNLDSLCTDPPDGWPLSRQREYLFWSLRVLRPLRGRYPRLEAEADTCCRRLGEQLGLPGLWVNRAIGQDIRVRPGAPTAPCNR